MKNAGILGISLFLLLAVVFGAIYLGFFRFTGQDEDLLPELITILNQSDDEDGDSRVLADLDRGKEAHLILQQISAGPISFEDWPHLSEEVKCSDFDQKKAIEIKQFLKINSDIVGLLQKIIKYPMVAYPEPPKIGPASIVPIPLLKLARLFHLQTCAKIIDASEETTIQKELLEIFELDGTIHRTLTLNKTISSLEAAIGVEIMTETRKFLATLSPPYGAQRAELSKIIARLAEHKFNQEQLFVKIQKHEMAGFKTALEDLISDDNGKSLLLPGDDDLVYPWLSFFFRASFKNIKLNRTLNTIYLRLIESQNHICTVDHSVICPIQKTNKLKASEILKRFFFSDNFTGEFILRLWTGHFNHYRRLKSNLSFLNAFD